MPRYFHILIFSHTQLASVPFVSTYAPNPLFAIRARKSDAVLADYYDHKYTRRVCAQMAARVPC